MSKKAWLDYPHDQCPVCGGGVKILTSCPQDNSIADEFNGDTKIFAPFAFCGDKWRCEDGHEGSIYCDSETPIQLEGGE